MLAELPPTKTNAMTTVGGGGVGQSSNSNSPTSTGPHPPAADANMHARSYATAVADGLTNPKSIGNLLAEEYTMNPTTFLPSFLEMNLVDATNASGRNTLHRILDGLRAKCDDVVGAGTVGSAGRSITGASAVLKVRLASYLSRLLARYRSELMLIILYGVEIYSLAKSSATAAEGVYGMKRSRVVMERGGGNENDDGGDIGGIRLAPLTQGDRVRCAIVAALLPYLREKLAAVYRNQQQPLDMENDGGGGGGASPSIASAISTPTRHERIRHKVHRVFRTVYPYLSMTTEGASLAYQFGYLAGLTGYYLPSMHMLGVLTRRITRADLQDGQDFGSRSATRARSAAQLKQNGTNGTVAPADSLARGRTENASKLSSSHPSGIGTAVMSTLQSGRADHIVRAIRTAIIVGGSTLLITGWVAHFREELRQRRRRWISGEDDGTANENGNSLRQQHQQQLRRGSQGANIDDSGANRNMWTPQSNPIPPPHPPKLLDETESACVRGRLPQDNTCCPICHRPHVNPAASTSGYVFCYRCLVMHLRSSGERCPLTGMHCPESRVIRLFEPTATTRTRGNNAKAADGRNRRDVMEGDKGQGAGQSTGFDN